MPHSKRAHAHTRLTSHIHRLCTHNAHAHYPPLRMKGLPAVNPISPSFSYTLTFHHGYPWRHRPSRPLQGWTSPRPPSPHASLKTPTFPFFSLTLPPPFQKPKPDPFETPLTLRSAVPPAPHLFSLAFSPTHPRLKRISLSHPQSRRWRRGAGNLRPPLAPSPPGEPPCHHHPALRLPALTGLSPFFPTGAPRSPLAPRGSCPGPGPLPLSPRPQGEPPYPARRTCGLWSRQTPCR